MSNPESQQIQLATLNKVANQFFKSLSELKVRHELFEKFPDATCGNTSEMLGYHLSKRFGLDVTYEAGDRYGPDWGSHAWLEVGNVIIDLTCCQFEDCPHVCPYVGEDRTWHDQWDLKDSYLASEPTGKEYWNDAYQDILSQDCLG